MKNIFYFRDPVYCGCQVTICEADSTSKKNIEIGLHEEGGGGSDPRYNRVFVSQEVLAQLVRAAASYLETATPHASAECPICGKEGPHSHSAEEVVAHRNAVKAIRPVEQARAPCLHPSWKNVGPDEEQCELCGATGRERRYLAVDGCGPVEQAGAQPVALIVATEVNRESIAVAVHLKRGASTTVVYSRNHALNGGTIGTELLPASLVAAPTPATDQDALDAKRYRYLRNQASQSEGFPPEDGSCWVVQYHHPRGTIPELASAGFFDKLDRNIDAVMAATPVTGQPKQENRQ